MVRIQEPKMEKEENADAQSSRYGNHPFSNSIISAPLPKGIVFDLPRMEQYDGSSDPQDHLSMFNIHMLFYGATDPIMCRAFPCTLSKHPLRWFLTLLPPNSINNFSDLSTKFLAHFSSSERSNDEKTTSRKRFCSSRETNSDFDVVDLAPITFSFDDSYYYPPGIKYAQLRDGPLPMVISTKINNMVVNKVLIDQGSSADILYSSQLSMLGITRSMLLSRFEGTLEVGVTGKRVRVTGHVDLDTTFGEGEGEGEQRRTIKVRYLVVEDSWTPSAYNVVIGRPALNELGAIVSTPHMSMKYPAGNGKVGVVKADLNMARKCNYDTHRDISSGFEFNDFPTKW